MVDHKKQYDDYSEFIAAGAILANFQKTHNVIRKDFMELLMITEANKSIEISFNALYRSSLRSLFSLIESDIYALNRLDQYKDYLDKDYFIVKLKETFKQIAKTWNKEEIQIKYFDSKLKELQDLKK
jgi:phosphoenolpyruvate synthase/pyruvate phosphate dikinase